MRYVASTAQDLSLMFDISWSEFLLIGIVALVVIGPKELPAVMRTLGQWMRKVRTMAGEFQNQFQEAMREAEMADLKKQVDDMTSDVRDLDPLKGLREDVESVGSDVQRSLGSTAEQTPAAEPALAAPRASPASEAVPASDSPAVAAQETPKIEQSAATGEPAGAPEKSAADAVPADSATRTG